MSFDRPALIAACRAHGRVARVVVANVKGSAPREVGAAMLVWDGGQSGTIGGGALEYDLSQAARRNLQGTGDRLSRHALGPDMGQCCGGSVEILTEIYDLARAEAVPDDIYARGAGPEPLPVTRLRARARDRGEHPKPALFSGWMVEPVAPTRRPLWIWGAGHVGRAIVDVLHPLPKFDITWVDTEAARFPARIPDTVTELSAARPAELVAYAPTDADHLILTYSHALDLDLCHRLLAHGFASAGLIGSRTKWARFRKRLRELGHTDGQIDRITCPIGDPRLGKHPSAIAIGVAAQLIAPSTYNKTSMESRA